MLFHFFGAVLCSDAMDLAEVGEGASGPGPETVGIGSVEAPPNLGFNNIKVVSSYDITRRLPGNGGGHVLAVVELMGGALEPLGVLQWRVVDFGAIEPEKRFATNHAIFPAPTRGNFSALASLEGW